jgi:hypothetical protein
VAADARPRTNFMKPKGFDAAPSMTSHTSRPSRSHMRAISLTRPMFTLRKVFSSSLLISAAAALESLMTRSIAWL